jgi:hypothetical protein
VGVIEHAKAQGYSQRSGSENCPWVSGGHDGDRHGGCEVAMQVLRAICVGSRAGESYRALQGADEQSVENLAGLVRVANILECFCRVLAANVEENFLTASVGQY